MDVDLLRKENPSADKAKSREMLTIGYVCNHVKSCFHFPQF